MPKESPFKKFAYPVYLLFIIALCYVMITTYRANKLYSFVKLSTNKLISSGILEYNPVLGYSPHPGGSGEMQFQLPPNIPINYDDEMFRIAPGYGGDEGRPLLLFIGCSWTHGDATRAENTFVHLVGTKMKGRYLNAGYHAYGLSQMLLRAREIIAKDKPDYVLVQYSPWLVSRSMRHFAGGRFLKRPVPYFVKGIDGRLELEPPLFHGNYTYPISDYRGYEKSLTDFASFTLRAALPFYFYQDINLLLYKVRMALGMIPEPHNDRLEIVKYVYGEIASLCRGSGCKMLIYKLDKPSRRRGKPSRDHLFVEEETAYLKSLPGVIYVDAFTPVLKPLKNSDEATYLKEYAHYRGDPPVLVDRHPNAKAHAIIAESIIEAIKK